MEALLTSKKQEVVTGLLQWLTRNNTDLELALNAYTILMELAENEATYPLLIESRNIDQLIEEACDSANPNQNYALHLLAMIIKEFEGKGLADEGLS